MYSKITQHIRKHTHIALGLCSSLFCTTPVLARAPDTSNLLPASEIFAGKTCTQKENTSVDDLAPDSKELAKERAKFISKDLEDLYKRAVEIIQQAENPSAKPDPTQKKSLYLYPETSLGDMPKNCVFEGINGFGAFLGDTWPVTANATDKNNYIDVYHRPAGKTVDFTRHWKFFAADVTWRTVPAQSAQSAQSAQQTKQPTKKTSNKSAPLVAPPPREVPAYIVIRDEHVSDGRTTYTTTYNTVIFYDDDGLATSMVSIGNTNTRATMTSMPHLRMTTIQRKDRKISGYSVVEINHFNGARAMGKVEEVVRIEKNVWSVE